MHNKNLRKKRLLCICLIVSMLFQSTGINSLAADYGMTETDSIVAEESMAEEDSVTVSQEESRETDETQKGHQEGDIEEAEISEESSEETAVSPDTREFPTEETAEAEKNDTESDVEIMETESHEYLQDEMYDLLSADGNIASGEIDESYGHIIWVIDKNGKLTVSGNGDYSSYRGNPPWQDYAEQITSAVVNVTGITHTDNMFAQCTNMTRVNLDNLGTSKVTSMGGMFAHCATLSSLNVSHFNTENVTNMYGMFAGCTTLSSLDVSHFNTENVTDMGGMFDWCNMLNSLDVSHFNTKNVTNMNGMFYQCGKLNSLNVSNFNTENVTDMGYMFAFCEELVSLDVSHFNTENVTNMGGMFRGCHALSSLDVSYFNTENVTDMGDMFQSCYALSSLDVSHFNTENVTDMSYMFQSCAALSSLDVSHFNTENVTDMSTMFADCRALNNLDVSHFNTENVTDMSAMFINCFALTNLDLSHFNTKNVTDMSQMFAACHALNSLDLSHFNTKNVIDMNDMFNSCETLSSLDVSNLNTENVADMFGMFRYCFTLTNLDVSNFNTEKVEDMCNMFEGCYALTNLDLSGFDMRNVLATVEEYGTTYQIADMFKYCYALTYLKSPMNCSVTVNLPTSQDTDAWYDEDGVLINTMPNTPVSVTLHKGCKDIIIKKHPQNCEGAFKDTMNFTVDAEGENLNYQWQVSEDGKITWHDLDSTFSGYNEKALKITALKAADGYEYRCRIWNDTASVVSDVAKITIKNSDKIIITSQPSDYIGDELGTAEFSVNAQGNSITYQWQVSEAPGKAWEDLSYSTEGFNQDKLKITFLRPKEGFRYRCVLTDRDKETAVSNAAKIVFGSPNTIKIISQPTYQKESANMVKFEIKAEGEGLSYRWQVSKDGGTTWTDMSYSTIGFNQSTMKMTVGEFEEKYQYRCKLSDKYDNEVFSDAAVPSGIKIISQPTYQKESADMVKFEIKAEGEELSYRWQVSKDGGTTWTDMSYSTIGFNQATMKISVNEFEKKYQYRCKVADKYGNSVISDIAVPKEEDTPAKKLSIHASDTMAIVGNTVKITAEVEPAQAWTESSRITYALSDTAVAELLDVSGKECIVLAKAPGKVIVRAALEGTKLTAQCELTIIAKSYTVKFETNGADKIEDIVIKEGEKITKPTDPTREGYTFGGWYSDTECTKEWDFAADTVTSDMTLYAKWIKKQDEAEKDVYSVYEENQRTNLSSCTISAIKAKVYDGKAYNPVPKVTLSGRKLAYGTDYRLIYSDNTNAGTGTVTVVGIGNYQGRKTQGFIIGKKNMKKLKTVVSSIAVGDLQASPIVVYDGAKRLQRGIDYDYQLTAADVGNRGNARIKVLALQDSNYTGDMSVKVPVIDTNGKLLIHNSDIALDATEYEYDGTAHKPNVTVTVNGSRLEPKKDYSVAYKNNKNAGTAYVIVKGKGKSYTGTAAAFFTIKPSNSAGNEFDSVVVNKGKNVVYNGKLQTPSVVVRIAGKKLSAKKDYTIEYTNNLIAGTGYVKITGINNYEGLTSTLPFIINPAPIKKASIKVKTTTEYTLKFKGRILVEGVDYDVRVGEPKKNGKADVIFIGRNNFDSDITKKNIKP